MTRSHHKPARIATIFAALILMVSGLAAQSPPRSGSFKNRYKVLQLDKFTIDPKVDMSNERLNVLMLEIADELFKIKKFSDIVEPPLSASSSAATADDHALRLTGTVISYYSLVPDGRAELFGHITLKVRFIDAASGEVLLEREIGRRVVAGPYQLNFSSITRGIAKELAALTKKTFF